MELCPDLIPVTPWQAVHEMLTHDVLDPQEVYGSDFPGETFRVLTKSPSFGGRRRS